jgi:SM-20-related protein
MAEIEFGHVVISDDMVPEDLQRRITGLTQGPIWKYGWRSSKQEDRFCFWHTSFADGGPDNRLSVEDQLVGKREFGCINDLWQMLKKGPLKGHEPLRIYANAHTYGVEGYVHTDNKDTENYFTTIYYAHPVWDKNWSGDTVFYTSDGQDIIKSVYPKPGRVVTFHGAMPHCARGPSRDCAELRISVVFKTQKAQLTHITAP